MDPRLLPIYDIEIELVRQLASQPRCIVTAPTGSGKSTQVPQMLLDDGVLGNGQAVVLQPRRLAARLLAARVASERGSRLGGQVGYQIRFENVTGPDTRIRYVTEAILLRQMIGSPRLGGVSAIVFDEFHERHLYGDVTLARALQLQQSARPDLKLLVMSATLDTRGLAEYLAPCELLHSEGRVFPVETRYLPRKVDFQQKPVWEVAAEALAQAVRDGVDGDALVFMPGAYEIRRTVEALRAGPARGWEVLPLHGDLPPDEQDAAVAGYGRRKVVVATNVAETSITIDGIRIVVDSGLARVARYDAHRGINALYLENISHAAADQRAGRAGRTAPGLCVRLWTEHEHRGRALHDTPEIHRVDLAEALLTLKGCGVPDLAAFPWLDPPEPQARDRGMTLLTDLKAIEAASGELTDLGRRMLSFPVHPRHARMLIAGERLRCVREAALIAALTQGRSLLLRGQGRPVAQARERLMADEEQSDLLILMRMWSYADQHRYRLDACRRMGIHAGAARQVGQLFRYFLRLAEREGLPVDTAPASAESVARCVLTGFVDHLALRRSLGTRRCDLIHGRRGELDRDSVVQRAPLFVAVEVREIESSKREVTVRLGLALAIEPEWLEASFPEDFNVREDVAFDQTGRRVVGRHLRLFRDLVLEERVTQDPPVDAAAELLADRVVAGEMVLKGWDHRVEQWVHRINGLRTWCPEFEIPAMGEEERLFLIQQICHGAFSYKAIKDRPVWPVLRDWLDPGQQTALDEYAPERIRLPSGRRVKISYAAEGPPTVAARIQDLYGVEGKLTIAMGRVPLRIEVLGPNHRPVQVTEDLARFWRETYPAVKKELQRRYPKHEWR